jgi:hypothetical protein
MTMRGETAMPPAAVLREVGALRRRARADRHAYWFPLLLFGFLTVGALPLYVERLRCDSSGLCVTAAGPGRRVLFVLGGAVLSESSLIGWYWLAALLIGGLATVWWYRWRAHRRGVQGRVGLAVLVGFVTLAAMFGGVLSWFGPYPWVLANLHGTGAFLVIATGLLALAWLERSVWLTVSAVVYAIATGLAIFYDVDNVSYLMGLHLPSRYWQWPNVLLPALVLLVGGGIAAVAGRRGPR